MRYCPFCMQPAEGDRCPNCGGDLNWKGTPGMELPVGTVLGNGLRTYWLGAAKGKGGFGITYVALEQSSKKRMAVKEYFPTHCAYRSGDGVRVAVKAGTDAAFQTGMENFLKEARMLLAQEDLTTVVKVIDFFQANNTAYLVMEYLDGTPLFTKMAQEGGRLPAGTLLPKLPPLLKDLDTLHSRGVVHRDISPDNILWMPDGTLKLLDFGSARSTQTGKSMTVMLKQGFSPIEQYRSRGQGPWTDVYAMAATIYYCLTGVTPPSAAERLDDDPLRNPNDLGAGLTEAQASALLAGMAVQPSFRPQTMGAFADALFAPEPEPEPAPEPKPEPAPPAPEPAKREPAKEAASSAPPAPKEAEQPKPEEYFDFTRSPLEKLMDRLRIWWIANDLSWREIGTYVAIVGVLVLLAALVLRSCAPPEAGIPALEPLLACVTGKEVPLWNIAPIV